MTLRTLSLSGTVLALSLATFGQTTPSPQFEAASIKRTPPSVVDSMKQRGVAPGGEISGNRYTSSALPLISVIRLAYNLKVYQVLGAPEWLSHDPYDIAAKAEGDRAITVDQARGMIQSLPADRLKLRVRRETKELPEYTLVVDRKGTKLRDSGAGQFSMNVSRGTGRIEITVSSGTMAQFAATLSGQVSRPVRDETGLKGNYDFKLEFAAESQTMDPSASSSAPDFPSVFTAVQEQLGLRLLEQKRSPVEVLVIDHVEKPSEN